MTSGANVHWECGIDGKSEKTIGGLLRSSGNSLTSVSDLKRREGFVGFAFAGFCAASLFLALKIVCEPTFFLKRKVETHLT